MAVSLCTVGCVGVISGLNFKRSSNFHTIFRLRSLALWLVSFRCVSFRFVSYALGMVFYPTKLGWFFHLQRSGTTPQCFPFLLRLTDSRFLAATCSVSHSARIQLGSSNPTRATVLFLPPLVVLFTLATSCCCPSCHLCHKNISSTCHRTAAHPKLTSAHTHRPPSFPFCVE